MYDVYLLVDLLLAPFCNQIMWHLEDATGEIWEMYLFPFFCFEENVRNKKLL